jgi:hypothetical protein
MSERTWLNLNLDYDRRSVGRSVLVSGSNLWPMTRFLFPLWQLQVSCCGAASLTRGRFCNLQYNCFWALSEQSLSGQSPADLTTIFYSLIWDSPQPGGPFPRIYIPQEQGGAVIPPRTGSLFVASYDSQGYYGGGILTHLHTGWWYVQGMCSKHIWGRVDIR